MVLLDMAEVMTNSKQLSSKEYLMTLAFLKNGYIRSWNALCLLAF